MRQCHKCGQYFEDDQQVRTYKMTLKQNLPANSILRRLEEVNLCYPCDSMRKTTIGKYLAQQ